MAACAFSTLCVGRHATARTRSLASQWSAPRPGVAVRPPALPQLTAVGSSSSYEFSTLSGSSKLGLQQSISGKDGGESTFDSAAFTSLVALAAASSMAMISSGSNYSAAAEPKPMATSDFAAPTASLQGPHSSEAPTKSHPKVQIRRTVRRLFSSDSDKNNKQKTQSELPRRFQFYRTADCDPAFTEDQKRDVLSAAKPYNVSFHALQGRRETMEDEVKVAGGGRFVAVFDGHGGGDVSKYLRMHLYDLFLLHLEKTHWEESDSDIEDIRQRTPSIPAYMTALREAIHSVETEVLRHRALNFVGSTAVAVVLHENPGGYRTLISANVGDSRAILSRNGKAIDLTKDHKPTSEGERKRILRAGGRIFLDDTGVHRVMNLSLSRAIGDSFSKPIVSAEPDIRRFRVEDDGDEFILLASDGMWDVMSSQNAVNFVRARLDDARSRTMQMSAEEREHAMKEARRNMAKLVATEALRLGSADNTSVVMVWLNEAQHSYMNEKFLTSV